MELGKNIILMVYYYLKENIYMDKEMEMERNIMMMEIYIIFANI